MAERDQLRRALRRHDAGEACGLGDRLSEMPAQICRRVRADINRPVAIASRR